MQDSVFSNFVLVGGTSLSLQLGHRVSDDIDVFTDLPYGDVDWEACIERFKKRYAYVAFPEAPPALGVSLYVGESKDACVKVDMFYTDPFVFPINRIDGIRLAALEEVCAMKFDIISRGGRKKDFWDIHAMMDLYTIDEMISFYQRRYPFHADLEEIKHMLVKFDRADEEWNPVCLHGKHWELIKLDIYESVSSS